MTELNNIILNMIKDNKSLNEICDKTNLSSKQLFYRLYLLRLKGYNFNHNYYYNGNIKYELSKNRGRNSNITLITDICDNNFKAIIISDLHLANKKERIDLLNKVYDFSINKNYNIIINAGDVVDGLVGNINNKKYSDIIKQIEYALKVYPYDKNILNFICFGNHDYDSLINYGINIETIFDIKRHDLVSLGYGYGSLYIKNDLIRVAHPKCRNLPGDFCEKGLIIEGHTHSVSFKENGYGRIIQVGSLSDVIGKYPPGFMTLNSEFVNGILGRSNIESFLYINDRFIKTSEYSCDLSLGKDVSTNDIKNEKDIKLRLSQIEKFNKKYNK